MKKIYPSLKPGVQIILIYLIPGGAVLFFLLRQEVRDWIKIFLIIFFAIIKYTKRDISRYGSPIVEAILKRGAKYIKEFIKPTLKSSAVSGGISAISNVASHYAQVLMEYIG